MVLTLTTNKEKAKLKGKLQKLLSKRQTIVARRDIATSFEPYETPLSETLSVLHRAIEAKQKVCFDYWEYDTSARKKLRASSSQVPIEPYAFLYKDEAYYLLAGKECDDRIEARTYRVDRMSDVSLLDEPHEGSLLDLGIALKPQLHGSFGMHVSGELTRVVLKIDRSAVKHVVEHFGPKSIKPLDEEAAIARVNVVVSRAFYAWVFQFGGKMRIEGPEEVVAGYKRMLEEALRDQDGLS